MNDRSTVCAEWSDRKLYAEIDAALVRAIGAASPNLRLGFLGGASALVGILAERAEAEISEAQV